jgi:hypothetical protein
MMNPMNLSEAERREKQQEAGLEFLPRLELVVSESVNNKTDNGNRRAQETERNQARQVLHRLSRDESFWGIALHELKRAAVTVPIFATAALGVLWVNKRFILK